MNDSIYWFKSVTILQEYRFIMLVLKSKCCIGVFVALNKLLQEIRGRVKLFALLEIELPSVHSSFQLDIRDSHSEKLHW